MLVIKGAKVFDGRKAAPDGTDVAIVGNTIEAVGIGVGSGDATTIDGTGLTLMPGMVEGHCHPSFVGIDENADLGRIGPEEHMLRTAQNLKLLLECGFTSIFEAASAKPMLGVTARDAIKSGLIVGPRMLAGSPEITTTAGLGDERKRHIYEESFGLVADGPDEMRRVARECVRDGVDIMKINISGDEFVSHARAEITPLEDDELAAFVRVARAFHKTTACHARSSESVKMAVRHGLDCIYHCDFADEEALDMLESVKDRIFVGPAFGLVHNVVFEGERVGMTEDIVDSMGFLRKFEKTCETLTAIRKRGLRVVVGGDYGFNITPMGTNARDIAHFVKYFGYSPLEALECATRIGGALMSLPVGEIRTGCYADLLLVRGDVLNDVSVLQHRDNLVMIMKDGVIYKNQLANVTLDAGLIAAE
ncbi:amidohydrolase family protein [Acuticoccus sp. M5D2P5]|uniref:metal-dependent hydrolase family protein n=1 Tax=Acuticoccus kalidii TaxID=2910977 RepID=UPI001F43E501|nr:amidohydrolase family protein [Acuticoccus kalidii]MCF3933589.1 amidohydrolase family protein [Acuticoccus kalidii]